MEFAKEIEKNGVFGFCWGICSCLFPAVRERKRIERKKKGNTLSFWAFFLLLLLSSASAFVKCWEGNGWNEEEFTPEEIAVIQRGLNDIENGRTHRMLEGESFDDFIDRIAACIK